MYAYNVKNSKRIPLPKYQQYNVVFIIFIIIYTYIYNILKFDRIKFIKLGI